MSNPCRSHACVQAGGILNRSMSRRMFGERQTRRSKKVLHARRRQANRKCERPAFERSASHNVRFLRHRFLPKTTSVATPNSLPKRNHIAKEAVSAAWQTKTRHRSGRCSKPNDAPRAKPRPCVKTMLCDATLHWRLPSEKRLQGSQQRCQLTSFCQRDHQMCHDDPGRQADEHSRWQTNRKNLRVSDRHRT